MSGKPVKHDARRRTGLSTGFGQQGRARGRCDEMGRAETGAAGDAGSSLSVIALLTLRLERPILPAPGLAPESTFAEPQ